MNNNAKPAAAAGPIGPDPDLIERYLSRRMTPEQEAAFEEHLLENPAAAAAVEDAERLRRGLRRMAAEDAAADRPQPASRSFFPRRLLPLAAAALVALALLPFGWSRQEVGRLERELAAARDAPAPAAILMLRALRGGAEDPLPVLELGRPDEMLVFALEKTAAEPGPYRVALRSGERLLLTLDGLAADGQGRLVFVLPAHRLEPGRLELVAESAGDPPRPAGRFRFEVARSAGGPSGHL